MVCSSKTKPQHTTVRIGLAQIQAEVDPSDPTVPQICCQSHTAVGHADDLVS